MGVLAGATRRDWNTWIGSEVIGVPVQDLDESESSELRHLVGERGVVMFRDQEIDVVELVRFALLFGEIVAHPMNPHQGHRDAFRLHNDGGSDHADGDNWHADLTWMDSPPLYSILMLDVLPPVGGDTAFVSTHAAAKSMSASFREFITGLNAVHERTWNGEVVGTSHPLVVRHPVTGLPCLYANSGYTARVEGLKRRESEAVLAHLRSVVALGVDFQSRAVWAEGTVAVWDNQSVQHHASWDYHPATRSGWRVTAGAARPGPVA